MLEKVKANLKKQFDYAKPSVNFEHMRVVVRRLLKSKKAKLNYRFAK
jgi:hypothetical protein